MIIKLFDNRNFILSMAFLCGLFFSEPAGFVQQFSLPALMVVMAASSVQLDLEDFPDPLRMATNALRALILHYLVLPVCMLVLAWHLVPTRELWLGFVLIAASPPGLAVLPFAHITRSSVSLAFFATLALYLASLVIMPLMIYVFAGATAVSPLRVFAVMVQLVVVPFVFAQLIKKSKTGQLLAQQKGRITNWGFFIVTYAVVGLNREIFVDHPDSLVRVFMVILLSAIAVRFLIFLIATPLNLGLAETRSYQLLGTLKNGGLSAGIALSFYSEAVSVPSAVTSVFYIFYFIYLGTLSGEKKPKPEIARQE